MPAGPGPARHRHPHDGLPAADGGVRRRIHLRMPEGRLSVGFVVRARLPGPDVRSARPLPALQAASVRVAACSRAGRWCATAPRRCPKAAGTRSRASTPDGVLIAGDAGGFLNSMRLKGIHLAMRTGMLAAETAFEAVRAGDTSSATRCRRYEEKIDASEVRRELYPVATSTRASATDCSPASRTPASRSSPAAGGFAIRCRRTPATSG